MKDIPSQWQELALLVQELTQPITKASFKWFPHGRPASVTLWSFNGIGVRVRSEMYDLAERTEVGGLTFDLVSSSATEESMMSLGAAFTRVENVSKLILEESGSTVESGLWIQSRSGQEILILPSSFPYLLAVRGLLTTPHIFEPEYPLDRYEVIRII